CGNGRGMGGRRGALGARRAVGKGPACPARARRREKISKRRAPAAIELQLHLGGAADAVAGVGEDVEAASGDLAEAPLAQAEGAGGDAVQGAVALGQEALLVLQKEQIDLALVVG